MNKTPIKLTEYSHGAGCGCKISPKVLDTILKTERTIAPDARLLVGNSSRDDAAVYDMGNGIGIISTTDFFMPIVDDPFDFGRIAATNAISDVYAMGGTPMMAIAILGWPINRLGPGVAQQVIEGGRQACADAGIQLAGGHSIDSPEPIFGLAVTGSVLLSELKQNNTATTGCKLYLTKPLGIGILTTAQKQKILKPEHSTLARDIMCQLNTFGKKVAPMEGVKALTDVTGFGLLGHLSEICEGSRVGAVVEFDKVPVISEAIDYLNAGAIPGGTIRNHDSYGHKVRSKQGGLSDNQKHILCDPQTSGGLLIAVTPESEGRLLQLAKSEGITLESFGVLTEWQSEQLIKVI
ncbi:selenide, water dikinase SelD [Alkalimarinus alittae]|uniref:Selenide, water dikinase n=1 Tax=Alkalimarinus alittae TaxID=2961619 RepID=A0ABY6MYA4_9ALTE|nr:selenide, water dikinase SelD [Alkalimarinus alittae]